MEILPQNNNGSSSSTPTAPTSSVSFPESHEHSKTRSNSTTRVEKKDIVKNLSDKEKRGAGGLLNKLRRRDKDSTNTNTVKDSKANLLRSTKSTNSLLETTSYLSASPTKSDMSLSPVKSNNMLGSSAASIKSNRSFNHLPALNSPTPTSSPVVSSSVASIFQFGYLSRKYEPVKTTTDSISLPDASSTPQPQSSIPSRFVLATTTNETFTLVNITEATDLQTAKQVILSKLGFFCSLETSNASGSSKNTPNLFAFSLSDFTFHLTDFGCSEGHVLDDPILSNLLLQPDKLGIPTSEPLRIFVNGKWIRPYNQKMSMLQKQAICSLLVPEFGVDSRSCSPFKTSYDPSSPGQISLEYEVATNTSHYPATPSHLLNNGAKSAEDITSDYFSHNSSVSENSEKNHLSSSKTSAPQSSHKPHLLTQQQQKFFHEYLMNTHKSPTFPGTGLHTLPSSCSGPIPNPSTPKLAVPSASSVPTTRSNSNVTYPEFATAANNHNLSIPFSGAFGHFSNFASFVQQPGFSNNNDLTLHGFPAVPPYNPCDSVRSSMASIDYTGRRSSEDSFKVIRPERREINFDDRRSSPYDRKRQGEEGNASVSSASTATNITSTYIMNTATKPKQGSHLNASVTQATSGLGPGGTSRSSQQPESMGSVGILASHGGDGANNKPLQKNPQISRNSSRSDRRTSTQQFVARRNAPPPPSLAQQLQQSSNLYRASSQNSYQGLGCTQVSRNNSKHKPMSINTLSNSKDTSAQGAFTEGPTIKLMKSPSTDSNSKSKKERIHGLVVNATRRPSGEGVSDSTGKLSPKVSPTSPSFGTSAPITPTFNSFDKNGITSHISIKAGVDENGLLKPETGTYISHSVAGTDSHPSNNSDSDGSAADNLNNHQNQMLLQQQQNVTPPTQPYNYSYRGSGPPRLDLNDFGSPGFSHDFALLGVFGGLSGSSPQSTNTLTNNEAAPETLSKTPTIEINNENPSNNLNSTSFGSSLSAQNSKRVSWANKVEEDPPSPKSPAVALVRQPSLRMAPKSPSAETASPASSQYTSSGQKPTGNSRNSGPIPARASSRKVKGKNAAASSNRLGVDAKFHENEISFEGAPELEDSSDDDDSSSSDEGLWAKKPPKPGCDDNSKQNPSARLSVSFGTTEIMNVSSSTSSSRDKGNSVTKSRIGADFDSDTDSDNENGDPHEVFKGSKSSSSSKSNTEGTKTKKSKELKKQSSSHQNTQDYDGNTLDNDQLARRRNLANNVSTASAASIQRNSQQYSVHNQAVPNIAPSAAATARARPQLHVDVTKTRGYSAPVFKSDNATTGHGGTESHYASEQKRSSSSSSQEIDSPSNGSDKNSEPRTPNATEEGFSNSMSSLDKATLGEMKLGGWAVRPPAEVLYENMERFFPNADLDRPIVLDPPGVSPPASPSVDTLGGEANDDGYGKRTNVSNYIDADGDDDDDMVIMEENGGNSRTSSMHVETGFLDDQDEEFDSNRPSSISSVSSMSINRGAIHTPLLPVNEPHKNQQQLQQQNDGVLVGKENSAPLRSQQRHTNLTRAGKKQSMQLEEESDTRASQTSQPSVDTQRPLSFTSTNSNEISFSRSSSHNEEGELDSTSGDNSNRNRRKGNFSMRTKSLRVVALEATERRKRFQSLANISTSNGVSALSGISGNNGRRSAEVAAVVGGGGGSPSGVVLGGSPGALLRRKSTKMWGQKAVEVKPVQFQKGDSGNNSSQQMSRLRDNRGKVKQFVWVKGELIGKGTFGKVYLAFNVTAGEMIAVKQVDVPQTLSDKNSELQKEVIGALHAEVETMKDLDHFNIVQYLGFEALPDTYNLFLEYIPGGTVGMALRKNGRFETSVSQYFTRQVLDGLSYLHSCGILHRDLKSDNILIDLDGVCKISDFGISKKSGNIYANDAQMSMQGTIFWMAPEVIHNVIDNEKQGYSAKVDIWSLGCVVLEMFAGRRPWSTDEAIGAMYKLGNARLAPPIPEDTEPFVTKNGKGFLEQCFQTNPDERPTAKELLAHPFCAVNTEFRFADTKLAKMIRVDDKEKTMMRESKMNNNGSRR